MTKQLLVYGPIEVYSAREFLKALSVSAPNLPPVAIRVNSPGGDLTAALTMANAVRAYRGDVTVHIEGMCASAATLLCCVAHTTCAEDALLMLHHPSFPDGGQAHELRAKADFLDQSSAAIVNMYATKTRRSTREIMNILDGGDRWFSADEAQAFGLVDEVTPALRIAACAGHWTIPPRFQGPTVARSHTDEMKELMARAKTVYARSSTLCWRFKTPEAFAQFCAKTVTSQR